jgi:hypothetical protein
MRTQAQSARDAKYPHSEHAGYLYVWTSEQGARAIQRAGLAVHVTVDEDSGCSVVTVAEGDFRAAKALPMPEKCAEKDGAL